MQKIYKVAVVGGGAAGLTCAVELLSGKNALNGEDVIILERNDRVGKKLIATGNGQGNLTNDNLREEFFYGDKKFINAFLSMEKEIGLKNYLEKLGIPLFSAKDGKVYPLSKQASSVLDIIRAFLQYKNCVTQTSARVEKILKNEFGFEVFYQGGKIFAENVVLSTGGAAAKQFGTDGSAYALAENFGHRKTEIYPSLVQLKTETQTIKGLKGLKENARVTAFSAGKPLKSVTGDLLFTEFGVSGSSVFAISASIAGKTDASLLIEFVPSLSYSQTERIIAERLYKPYFSKDDVLCGVVNKKIGQAVIKTARGSEPKDIAYALKNFKLKVTGSLGFDYAQVTRGGIKTDCIDELTMESKIQKGLYVIGEILDIDGDCGGYNLTFAFVSAIVAARSVKGV